MQDNSLFEEDIPPQMLVDLFKKMTLIRRFEEKIIDVYPQQEMKTPVHLYIGEEAIAAGVCAHLCREDYIFSTHRNHGHCLAKGIPPAILLAEFYGKKTGCSMGKGGSMHPVAPECGILGTTAIVGGGIPLAVGAALASSMKGDDKVSVVFFGDGASEEGSFHESLNFASLKRLPVVFVCENNFYATNSPIAARQPNDCIAKKAEGHGIPGVQVNANEVLDIYRAAHGAVRRARAGEGPSLLECRTYRWKGHVGPECDYEKGCRSRQELEAWMEKCPVNNMKNYLLKDGVISEEEIKAIVSKVDMELDAALLFAKESPFPGRDELLHHVYFERA